jgi:hypothetical protein
VQIESFLSSCLQNLPVAQPIRFEIAINLKNGQVRSNILQFIFDVGGIRALRSTLHHRVACRVSLVGLAASASRLVGQTTIVAYTALVFFAHAERRAAGSWLKIGEGRPGGLFGLNQHRVWKSFATRAGLAIDHNLSKVGVAASECPMRDR